MLYPNALSGNLVFDYIPSVPKLQNFLQTVKNPTSKYFVKDIGQILPQKLYFRIISDD